MGCLESPVCCAGSWRSNDILCSNRGDTPRCAPATRRLGADLENGWRPAPKRPDCKLSPGLVRNESREKDLPPPPTCSPRRGRAGGRAGRLRRHAPQHLWACGLWGQASTASSLCTGFSVGTPEWGPAACFTALQAAVALTRLAGRACLVGTVTRRTALNGNRTELCNPRGLPPGQGRQGAGALPLLVEGGVSRCMQKHLLQSLHRPPTLGLPTPCAA